MPFLRLAFLLLLALPPAQAEVVVRDAGGATVRLAASARRIVSLAPHATENLFAAGAGGKVVGAVDYSDFPAAAARLPRVGSYDRPDLEALLALKPDLVIAWESGNPPAVLARLRTLGIALYRTQPDHLADIASEIENLGRLAGSEATANQVARQYRQRLADLRGRYGSRPPVTVFYQIWNRPLMTVGGAQIISEAIQLCGGANLFAGLAGLSPAVSVEAVLAGDPEAIVASGMGSGTPVGLDDWRAWKQLRAVVRGNLFYVSADLMQRPTPRLLDGALQLCRQLEMARGRRP
jgi:iron complex transport system substrate-binding protein